MNFPHLTSVPPETFESIAGKFEPIHLNPHGAKFLLRSSPTLIELEESIEAYGIQRLEDRWEELMAPTRTGNIAAISTNDKRLANVSSDIVCRHFNSKDQASFLQMARSMDATEQRSAFHPLKPKSIAEMLAFYRDADNRIDQTGYRFLKDQLTSSASAVEFFGKLTNALSEGFSKHDWAMACTVTPAAHQSRILEYLGLSLTRGWILFPCLNAPVGSEHLNFFRAMTHRSNTQRYINPRFGPPAITAIKDLTRELASSSSYHQSSTKHIERLMVCSTYRNISQSSSALFMRMLEISKEKDDSNIFLTSARRGFNSLLMLFNSRHPESHKQAEIVNKITKGVKLEDFSSFEAFTNGKNVLKVWGNRLSGFLQDISGTTPAMGVSRKTFCTDLLGFLDTLTDPPARPELTTRGVINDMTDSGMCFRNFLKNKYQANVCNKKIVETSNFFDYCLDQLRAEHSVTTKEPPWFPNPVDVRFDKFSSIYRAGTTRKSIGADILQEMRIVLTENDYAWPKQFNSDWAFAVNSETRQLENVWCPSTAVCLYFMLTLPVRSIQARMLDSGEGDANIFDFESKTMIPNEKQLPVKGKMDKGRKEGFLQVVPSGLSSEPNLVGIWIGVNKTSDIGYVIPWINEELMGHLRYQRDWIFRYAPDPEMRTIDGAQGHRNSPEEWVELEKPFYCLFRDASNQWSDKSLPVSKQKLLRMWGELSLEVQNRINSRAIDDAHRVMLVKEDAAERDMRFKAVHDLHTLRVSGITDLLDRGVPLNIVSEYIAGHATYMMTLWYDKPTPAAVRRHMLQASRSVGETLGPIPRFSESELHEMKPFLLSNPNFNGMYTGFDALEDHAGLVQVRQAGVCPGTRCEEGGLDDNKRITNVPIGDRGPSCPQCRFWLTGPAFLLGQAIEGNQLILKIRIKVISLAKIRERILDAEDASEIKRADLLRGNADVEERQLNDMLTEWWHRMRVDFHLEVTH